jgi:hypothetical protein
MFRQEKRLWEEHRVNNFIMKLPVTMKLPGRISAAVGGIADCAATAPVLAFDPRTRDRIAAAVHDGSGWNPACTRVGTVH